MCIRDRAQALLDTVLGKLAEKEKPAYEILETYKGKDLEYKEYEPLFACACLLYTSRCV